VPDTRRKVSPSGGHRYVFVGGSPRSGTTLVQNMLDSHPKVLGGPEFLHLPDIVDLRNKLHASVQVGWIDEFCSGDDVDRHIGHLIDSLLLPLAERYECELLSEKTPFNVLVFSELLELFPDARCIHVIRDPRAIVSSMLQVGERARAKGWQAQAFTRNIARAIDQVQACLEAGFEAERLAPDRVLEVVYERLVSNPGAEAKRMCGFLNLDWSAEMLHPADHRHLGERAVTERSAEVWYDQEAYYRNPDTRDMEKWKSRLSPLQKAMVNASFRNITALRSLGFDFGPRMSWPFEWLVSMRLSLLRAGSLGTWVRRRLAGARKAVRALAGSSSRRLGQG